MKIFGVFRYIPFFAVMWVAINVLLFLDSSSATSFKLTNPIHTFALPSKVNWAPTYNDAIVFIGLFLLYIEIFKSTDVSDTQIFEHVLSLFTFLAYLFEFLFVAQVGNSTFLILCGMSFLDVIAGLTISISAGRRDISIGGGIG